MFVERRINNSTGQIDLWKCDWENRKGAAAKKLYIEKIGVEETLEAASGDDKIKAPAICWSYGRTLGNIAVHSQNMLGNFPEKFGNDAVLPCEFVDAGKYRHGAARWWCRTHQCHWGAKADLKSHSKYGKMVCANHLQQMNYVVSPEEIKVEEYAEASVWCSMPPALSTYDIKERPPQIHVHLRTKAGKKKIYDGDLAAFAFLYSNDLGLFGNDQIERVNITPPAAFDFVVGLETGKEMDCINCSHCGYPHLDLGDFAREPHRKHFCANCGRDSTWSKKPIVSTPLKPLHDKYAKTLKVIKPDRSINLDDYPGHDYTIWASTPAIIWTADRPQEHGIHVHVDKASKRVVDETFSEVLLNGEKLDRGELFEKMMERTIV